MNERRKSDSFQYRIVTYVVITAVVQGFFGILFALTYNLRGPTALAFLVPIVNFAYLLLSETMYPLAFIIGTFFMFLMILAVGEILHEIRKIMPSIPPDPLEEALKHEQENEGVKP